MEIIAVIIAFITSLFSPKPSPMPAPIPVIEMVSPAPSNTLVPTPKLTTVPTKKPVVQATKIPVPTTKQDPCSAYDKSAPSSSVKVSYKSKTSYNNTLKIIEIKSNGCPNVKSGSSDKETKTVFSDNGETSFGNLYPGPYTVTMRYSTGLTSTSPYSTNTSAGQTSTVTIELP